MKVLKRIVFLAIAVFSLTLSSSCSSDSSDGDSVGSAEGFIKYKYNGVMYTFEDPALITSLNTNIMGNSGIDDTYKKISLWTPLNITTGSHPIVYDLSNIETTYQATFSFMPSVNNRNATSGTINITVNNSERIEGTFNFSGTNGGETFTVTDGSFRVEKY